MPRDDGFAVADTATGKLDDPKFRRLWRRVHDEAAMNTAAVLYESVQLASWAAGERVTADDAAPFWMESVDPAAANLRAVGLLDDTYCIPAKSWESWFGVARDRRQKRRDAGQLGGRPPKQSPTKGKPSPNHLETTRITTDNPDPSVPTVPSYPAAPTNGRAIKEEEPFVTLTDDEKAARRQKDRDELMARTMERLGVKP